MARNLKEPLLPLVDGQMPTDEILTYDSIDVCPECMKYLFEENLDLECIDDRCQIKYKKSQLNQKLALLNQEKV